MERARAIELQAIGRLRRRIEGDVKQPWLRRGARGAVIAAAIVLAAISGAWFGGSPGDSSAPAASSHAGHAAAGSGLAVSLEAAGPSVSRTSTGIGETTFNLRNQLAGSASVSIKPMGAPSSDAQVSPPIMTGERIEWQVSLVAGSYHVRSLVDGEPVGTDTMLTVA